MIKLFEPRKWFMAGVFSGLIIILVASGAGCASTTQTTKTETTATSPEETANNGEQGTTVTSETTTTTTETTPENPGVISSTLHAIGYVLVLPFIIIGGLFKIIFGG